MIQTLGAASVKNDDGWSVIVVNNEAYHKVCPEFEPLPSDDRIKAAVTDAAKVDPINPQYYSETKAEIRKKNSAKPQPSFSKDEFERLIEELKSAANPYENNTSESHIRYETKKLEKYGQFYLKVVVICRLKKALKIEYQKSPCVMTFCIS